MLDLLLKIKEIFNITFRKILITKEYHIHFYDCKQRNTNANLYFRVVEAKRNSRHIYVYIYRVSQVSSVKKKP